MLTTLKAISLLNPLLTPLEDREVVEQRQVIQDIDIDIAKADLDSLFQSAHASAPAQEQGQRNKTYQGSIAADGGDLALGSAHYFTKLILGLHFRNNNESTRERKGRREREKNSRLAAQLTSDLLLVLQQ